MKKYLSAVLACIMCFSLYSCDKEKESSVSEVSTNTITSANDTEAKNETTTTNNPQNTEPLNTDIAKDRLVTDNTEIINIANKHFEAYFNGIKNGSHDECFSGYPDFYKKAVEKENKEYNQENDEYIKEIDANLASTYGDDYYAYATVSAILQIVDTSLAEMESIINKSFNIDIELEDAFSVQVNQVVRGKLDSTSKEMEYLLIKVDGKYYLYDQYYETA